MKVSLLIRLGIVVVTISGLLPSCQSTQSADSTSSRPKSLMDRMLKPDMAKKSQFDKKFSTASLGDRGAMKLMGAKSYGTSDYKGNTKFRTQKDYATKAFAQAGKSSRAETQVSSMGSKSSNFADKSFATKDSRFSDKKAQGSGQVFRDSKEEFHTSEFGPAKKSLESDKRPFFKPAGELEKTKNAYTEADVKAMLNR